LFAFNSGGNNWSTISSFKTLSDVEISSSSPSYINDTYAHLSYSIISDGNYGANVKLFFGSFDGGTIETNWEREIDLGLKIIGNYTFLLDSLTTETLYFYVFLLITETIPIGQITQYHFQHYHFKHHHKFPMG